MFNKLQIKILFLIVNYQYCYLHLGNSFFQIYSYLCYCCFNILNVLSNNLKFQPFLLVLYYLESYLSLLNVNALVIQVLILLILDVLIYTLSFRHRFVQLYKYCQRMYYRNYWHFTVQKFYHSLFLLPQFFFFSVFSVITGIFGLYNLSLVGDTEAYLKEVSCAFSSIE